MRFEEAFSGCQEGRLTQDEAARLLGVCDRTFRRRLSRHEESGLDGLLDKRLTQASNRLAPVDEVTNVAKTYRDKHMGFNVKHFYSWYIRLYGGGRSYSWVKNTLQADGAVGNDNCVRFEGLTLQIPPDKHRCHYIKAKVRVHRYCNGRMAIFHGPRKLCVYDTQGKEIKGDNKAAA
jgi:hypothetical protein